MQRMRCMTVRLLLCCRVDRQTENQETPIRYVLKQSIDITKQSYSHIRNTAVISLCRESVFLMIRIVSANKLLGTLCFQFIEVDMASHTGLCDLDN